MPVIAPLALAQTINLNTGFMPDPQRFQGMAELQQAWRTNASQALQLPVDQGEPAKTPVAVAPPTTPVKKRHAGPILARDLAAELNTLLAE